MLLPAYGPPMRGPVLSVRMVYTPKANRRNRIPGTHCTELAVSCTGFRGVGELQLGLPSVGLRHADHCR
eukprot:2217743-Rhodomonas_salina.3